MTKAREEAEPRSLNSLALEREEKGQQPVGEMETEGKEKKYERPSIKAGSVDSIRG